MSDRVSKTDRIELVETHNIMLSLNRMTKAPYDDRRWKRAVIHALGMSELGLSWEEQQKIREALKLP